MTVRAKLLIAAAAVLLGVALLAAGPGGTETSVAAPTTSTAVATTTPRTVLDNDFIPAEANLTDCVSSIQRPGCGSSARGGWRQNLVLALLVAGLAFIAWRIVRGARRGRVGTAS